MIRAGNHTAEPPKVLPPKYYLDNFNSLLDFVDEMYAGLLRPNETDFIRCFRALNEDARCLYLRFANRKGLFFRPDKLVYPEIGDLRKSLDELLCSNFIEYPDTHHQLYAKPCLSIFSRPELLRLGRNLGVKSSGFARLRKEELVDFLLSNFSWEQLLKEASSIGPVVKYNYEEELEILKFLYFGYLGGDMSEFVVRDLGILQMESVGGENLVPKFKSREEIDELYNLSRAYAHFKELLGQNNPELLYNWYCDFCSSAKPWGELAQPLWSRLCLKVAREMERNKLHDPAIDAYSKTDMPPSRERRVRLFQQSGEIELSLALCEQIVKDPKNTEELFFAQDFVERLNKRKAKKKTTRYLTEESEEVLIGEEYRWQVESGVIRHFQNLEMQAFHSENYLWRNLFGLLFWDIVFDHKASVYHSPLQAAPSDLFQPAFFKRAEEQLLERMSQLDNNEKLVQFATGMFAAKQGLGNPLVSWHESTLPIVSAACRLIRPDQLKKVLLEMARNLKENGRGFPDLFIWCGDDYFFAEVKSPTDTLSARQLYWLWKFKEWGIKSKVLKVVWVSSPSLPLPSP